jgi:hypothetical protein
MSGIGATDEIDVQIDLVDEECSINANFAALYSTNGSYIDSDGNTETLNVTNGLTQAISIYDLEIRKSAGNDRAFAWFNYGAGSSVNFSRCTFNYSDGSAQYMMFLSAVFNAANLLVFDKCNFIVSGGGICAAYIEDATGAGSIVFKNCKVNGSTVACGITINEATSTKIVSLYNNTIVNCTTGLICNARGDFTNNIFANNTDDISIYGSGNLADFVTGGFEQAGEALPAGNLCNNNGNAITSSNEFVNEGAGDYHLKSGADCIGAGTDLSGTVDDDFDGVARPQGAAYDIGAYEFVESVVDRSFVACIG